MTIARPGVDFLIRDFSAGFLDTPQARAIPPGASPDAKNVMLSHAYVGDGGQRQASFRRRYGHRLINTTAMNAATPVESLINYERDNAAAVMLAVCNGGLFSWDGATTFSSIAAGIFTTGRPVNSCLYKNLAFLMDGAVTKLYDGTTLGDPGLTTPGAIGLATAAGPGVTGDYDGYGVWVNSARVIISSPGTTSSVVTFANQQRQWTRPAAPPAGATHWRVYCRKSNERNYFQTGVDQTAATATYTEAIADSARTQPGPDVSSNDPPPAFEGMVVWNGVGVGWKRNDSTLYFSKPGYLESWNPSQAIGLTRNQKIRAVSLVGSDCVVHTDAQSFILEGDKFPFALKNLHTQWGNASAQSWQEIDGLLYGFDVRRGPYVTDTVNFTSIADGKIRVLLNTLLASEIGNIRSFHYQKESLIGWAIATGTSVRRRTIVAYNYRLRAWLPPMTGMEWASFTTFTNPVDASIGLYTGDYWGRVYQAFTSERDGTPSGSTHTGTITAATSSTITCAAATFATTGNGLAGLPVGILSPSGTWTWRRVQSNTATVLTLDTVNDPVLSTVPSGSGWMVYVGAIEAYWWTPIVDLNSPQQKRGGFLTVLADGSAATSGLDVWARYNGHSGVESTFNFIFDATGAIWGVSTWGGASWGSGATLQLKRARLMRSFYAIQLRFSNYYPDQVWEVGGFGIGMDWLPKRRANV